MGFSEIFLRTLQISVWLNPPQTKQTSLWGSNRGSKPSSDVTDTMTSPIPFLSDPLMSFFKSSTNFGKVISLLLLCYLRLIRIFLRVCFFLVVVVWLYPWLIFLYFWCFWIFFYHTKCPELLNWSGIFCFTSWREKAKFGNLLCWVWCRQGWAWLIWVISSWIVFCCFGYGWQFWLLILCCWFVCCLRWFLWLSWVLVLLFSLNVFPDIFQRDDVVFLRVCLTFLCLRSFS